MAADDKPAARGKAEARLEPATKTAFEWSAAKGEALDAAHEGQFAELAAIAQKRKQPNTAGFGMVGSWVLNGWAMQDPGDIAHAWILTDKGRALTEADFDAGVAAFFGLSFS